MLSRAWTPGARSPVCSATPSVCSSRISPADGGWPANHAGLRSSPPQLLPRVFVQKRTRHTWPDVSMPGMPTPVSGEIDSADT